MKAYLLLVMVIVLGVVLVAHTALPIVDRMPDAFTQTTAQPRTAP